MNFPEKSFEDIRDCKILVVDDEETNVKLLELLLQRNGYHSICQTTDPREVEQIYQEFRPDLVLLDLNMPHMDGVEVVEKIHKIEKETYPSIVIITANHDDESNLRN